MQSQVTIARDLEEIRDLVTSTIVLIHVILTLYKERNLILKTNILFIGRVIIYELRESYREKSNAISRKRFEILKRLLNKNHIELPRMALTSRMF
ncbi:hypothetical protein PUN28_010535 [Cardiocondyla obscurior]|uniref:Uncharacterized protein n=1 Tax=Cardiocondyla obscurior TaxID=286306 RepID=A0AAW2FM35_9HYME